MLTKAFQETWAAALESGKYKQGTRQLRSEDNEYCCLGVASDLVCPTKWRHQWENNQGPWGVHESDGNFRTGYMARECRNEIGLTHDDERVLSHMNDEGATFPEIAKYIRAMPTKPDTLA